MKRHWFLFTLSIIVLLAITASSVLEPALAAGGGSPVPADLSQADSPDDPDGPQSPSAPLDTFLYLPQLVRHTNRLAMGQVTYRKAPVAGTSVELRFYDGANWSTLATTLTDSQGYYSFISPPLAPNQAFYARWYNNQNGSNPSRLWFWRCYQVLPTSPSLTSYCNFDVENTAMLTPAPSEKVKLPYTFTWNRRVTTTDSYEFDLYDIGDSDPYFYTSPLGYVGSYRLAAMPAGFVTGVDYGWDIYSIGPKGYGLSYYFYRVQFKTGSASSSSTFSLEAVERDPNQVYPDESPLHPAK